MAMYGEGQMSDIALFGSGSAVLVLAAMMLNEMLWHGIPLASPLAP